MLFHCVVIEDVVIIYSQDLRASLEEAATDAMGQSGFVYDHRTGLYYDWNSGYYYDPVSFLEPFFLSLQLIQGQGRMFDDL